MCPFDYTAVAVSGKVGPVNQVNHTSWVAVVTSTDHNRCVIELYFALFVLSFCPFDISVGVWAFVIGLSQISSFFSWNFVPMKYSWFAAYVNVIRANVSSMVVTLVSDWFHYFYLQLLLGFQRNLILEVNCVLFMLFRIQRWPDRFLIGWHTFQFSATATPNGQGFFVVNLGPF